MRRLLLCLPLSFVFLPHTASREPLQPAAFRDVSDDGSALPDEAGMERLARTDPMAFLENCLRRYDRTVKGYRCTLQKQERIDGKLERTEVIAVDFREKPFSVRMNWKQGARLAQAILYVQGEDNGRALILPAGLLAVAGVVSRDPYGSDAKQASRYPITEFGIKVGTQRTLASWEKARKHNALHVEFLGTKRIKEAGNRDCWVLRRTGYRSPEEDGITELTVYVDRESWLQVGSVIKGPEGKLVGEYFFRDVQLNPEFKADTFTREALRRAAP